MLASSWGEFVLADFGGMKSVELCWEDSRGFKISPHLTAVSV